VVENERTKNDTLTPAPSSPVSNSSFTFLIICYIWLCLPLLYAQEGAAFLNLESKENYSDSSARVLSDGGATLPRDLEVILTTPSNFL